MDPPPEDLKKALALLPRKMHPPISHTKFRMSPDLPHTEQTTTFPAPVVSARPHAPLCRSWTSTGTSMGGSGSLSCWAWIWPRWRSQPTMSASLDHHRGCSPGELGRTTPTPRPGAGGGGGCGLILQHLANLVFSALQAYVHRCEVPDLEVRGHLHRQCEEGPVGGGGVYR